MQTRFHKILCVLLTLLLFSLSLFMTVFTVHADSVRYREVISHSRGQQNPILDYTIFEDSLAHGWVNCSWGSKINLANTSPRYSGNGAISFTATRSRGALCLYTKTAVHTTPHSYLRFAAQASQGGQKYSVRLFDSYKNRRIERRLATFTINPIVGTWKVYTIPLSDLSTNATQIRGVVIQSRTALPQPALYVDTISMMDAVSPTSTATVTPTSTFTPTPSFTPTPTLTLTPTFTPTPALTQASEGHIYWVGDWETGDTSQWAGIHTGSAWGSNSSITVGSAPAYPVRQGKYSAKFVTLSGTRAEATATQANTGGYPGQEWFYSWSLYIPSSPDKTSGWDVGWGVNVMQWMDLKARCTPPISVAITAFPTPHFNLYSDPLDNNTHCTLLGPHQAWNIGPVHYDTWIDFTVHLYWSADPAVGFAEVWVNGTHVLPLTHMRTLDTDPGVYLEAQLYHGASNNPYVIYHDALRRHDAYQGITITNPNNPPPPPISVA